MSKWQWLHQSAALAWEDWARPNAKLLPFNAAMAVFCLLYHFGGVR